MPRDGSNTYAPPGGTAATTLTPISSSAYNSFVADIAQDQNTARPVTAGGTGANNAADARANLGAGNVEGPTTTVDNTVPRFNGTGGDLQTSGVTIDDSNNVTVGGVLTAIKTDDGATGAQIVTQHISASPASNDVIADWLAQGKDSAGNTTTYGDIQHIVTDPADASEDGVWAFLTRVAGTLAERFRVGAGLYMQGATGGDPGTGKINATEMQQSGVALRPMVTASAQTTTSGTAFDFGSIPSWAKRVNVLFSGVSLSGSDDFLVQIGDSDGIEATGYVSDSVAVSSGSAVSTSTSGFIIRSGTAGRSIRGTMTLEHAGSNVWVAAHVLSGGSGSGLYGGGDKTLSATLDRVRITRDGTNTFDAGSVTISYE